MPPKKRNLRAVGDTTGVGSRPRSTKAQHALRVRELFALVASGLTVSEAGRRLRMTGPQASKAFNDALTEVAESDLQLRQNMLLTELETLRLLKKAHMPFALSGDATSARIVLQTVSQIADMAGLSQTLKIQISNQRIDETVGNLVSMLDDGDDQIPQLLAAEVLTIEGETIEPSRDDDADAG